MAKNIIISLIVLLFPLFLKAQASSRENILALKDGYLFVRLHTSRLQIEALQKAGKTAEAEKLIQHQRDINLETTRAFMEEYQFSKVYFFYSDCSVGIKNKIFQNCILNENLEVIDFKLPDSANFFIAEFGHVEDMDFGALLIMDHGFNQLEHPFPYYVRTFDTFLFLERSKKETVHQLNKNLYGFYSGD